MMRITLKQLAEMTELSVTAVSMILNHKPIRVSEEKRQKVIELAREYNYRPNSLAKGLVTKRSKIIGLVIPDITNYFFAETAKYIESILNEQGYSLILCNTNDQSSEEEKYVDLLLSRDVEAMIICSTTESLLNQEQMERFKKLDIVCVAIDRWNEAMGIPHVAIDNEKGAYLAVEHLITNGHERIGCISGPLSGLSARQRLSGYRKALEDHHLIYCDSVVFEGDYQFQSGYDQGKKLLETQSNLTAIFVCNDMMAYGVYKAIREKDLRIPDDISVVGFDDLLFSTTLDVPLTSLKQSTLELAQKACEVVIHNLSGINDQNNYVLTPTLTIRQSVKRIR